VSQLNHGFAAELIFSSRLRKEFHFFRNNGVKKLLMTFPPETVSVEEQPACFVVGDYKVQCGGIVSTALCGSRCHPIAEFEQHPSADERREITRGEQCRLESRRAIRIC
jgi:hypothetical protein